jgi:hypothetical protein
VLAKALTNNDSGQTLEGAGVYGRIENVKEGMSVLGNGQDGKNDAGQFAMIDKIQPGATDVEFMGHVKVILKTDNGPALLALATASLLNIRIDAQKDESSVQNVSIEHSAEYESQSNGGTECGIRAVRGIFRTIKVCLEERVGQKIPPTHALSAWLV